MRDPASRARIAMMLAMVFAAACTEPMTTRVQTPPEPALHARLELSDSLAAVGSEVRVALRIGGTSAATVGSFTARLAYDSTGLRYVDETAIADSATRAINPQPGLLRLAGIAPQGFGARRLYEVRFAVLRGGALASLRLTMDELHTTTHADVLPKLVAGAQ